MNGIVTIEPLAPERIEKLLALAAELGMVVEFTEYESGCCCWTISSGKHLDFDKVWVYWWGPGPNGGRAKIKRYCPFARRKPSRITNLTFRDARTWMRILAK